MKNKQRVCIISAFASALVILLLAVFVMAPVSVLVIDPAWQVVLPQKVINNFRQESIKALHRPVVVKCTSSDLRQLENITSIVERYRNSSIIIMTPLVSSVWSSLDYEADRKCTIVALSSDSTVKADLVLVADYEGGWDGVPQELKDNCISNKEITKITTDNTDTRSYIVDYRYSQAVPQDRIQGLIVPDLGRVVAEVLEGTDQTTGRLYHVYSKN